MVTLLATEMSLSEIGRQLCLSHNTVKTYTPRAYRKLGAGNRHEAVAEAHLSG